MLLSLMFKSITFVSLYTQITSTMIGIAEAAGGEVEVEVLGVEIDAEGGGSGLGPVVDIE